MEFHPGKIDDVIWKPLQKYHDARGWLCELFRQDEVVAEYLPAMAYISMSLPGIARGPHEHVDQSDFFCFLGPSTFKVYLWDNRLASRSYRARETALVGADNPMAIIIPPGIVHAYKNIGTEPGLVFNCPNRLFKGPAKKQPVDEIRHEENRESPFRLD
jgi:dTDP-4-dehydrorhamnose 3,5-epimerase